MPEIAATICVLRTHIDACVSSINKAESASQVKHILEDTLLLIKPVSSTKNIPLKSHQKDLSVQTAPLEVSTSHDFIDLSGLSQSKAASWICDLSDENRLRWSNTLVYTNPGQAQFRRLVQAIITCVGVDWLACFTQAEKKRLYDPFFLHRTHVSLATCVFNTLSAMLRHTRDVDVQGAVVDVLMELFATGCIRTMWRSESQGHISHKPEGHTSTNLEVSSTTGTYAKQPGYTDTHNNGGGRMSVLAQKNRHRKASSSAQAIAIALRSLPDIAANAYGFVAPPLPLRHDEYARALMHELVSDVCGAERGCVCGVDDGNSHGRNDSTRPENDTNGETYTSSSNANGIHADDIPTQERHTVGAVSQGTCVHYDSSVVGAIISSLCIGAAQADTVCDVLVREAYVHTRGLQALVACIPEMVMDRIVHGILSNTRGMCNLYNTPAHTYAVLERLLSGRVRDPTRPRCAYLLTNTCVLRHVYTPSVAVGIVRLLGAYMPQAVVPMLTNLVAVWGDEVSMRHTPYTQHFYQTVVIMACMAQFKTILPLSEDERLDVVTNTMGAIHAHINTPITQLRSLGMAAAMHIQKTLTPQHNLAFDIQPSDDTELLAMVACGDEWPQWDASHIYDIKESEETYARTLSSPHTNHSGKHTEHSKTHQTHSQTQLLERDSQNSKDSQRVAQTHTHADRKKGEEKIVHESEKPRHRRNERHQDDLDKPLFGAGGKSGSDTDTDTDSGSDSESDSDDDGLLPYDLPTEEYITDPEALKDPKAPPYLRTCVMGLRASADKEPQRIAASLKVAAVLIAQTQAHNPTLVREVCEDMLTILLHLADDLGLANHAKLRMDAMVAMATAVPDVSGKYLAEQFYTENYNLIQRFDVLKVLETAAVQLSAVSLDAMVDGRRSIQPITPGSRLVPLAASDRAVLNEGVRAWGRSIEVTVSGGEDGYSINNLDNTVQSEEVVLKKPATRKPVERRFKKAAFVEGQYNKFAKVAHYSFYGLMSKFDAEKSARWLGEAEGMLLSSLLNTLGTMMRCASNAPPAVAMATALIDFVFAVRFHSETAVRRSSLYALLTILTSLPHEVVLVDLAPYLTEILEWLHSVAEAEADVPTRDAAVACASALHNIEKKARAQ